MRTYDKIQKILGEISDSDNNNTASKTMDDIKNILLNGHTANAMQHNTQQRGTDDFKCDMHEFDIWHKNNNNLYRIEYYRPVFSHRKFIGKFLILFRRLVRRLLRFLIEPIVQDQNNFNGSVTASINALHNNAIVYQHFIEATLEKFNNLKNTEVNIEKIYDLIEALKNHNNDNESRLNEIEIIQKSLYDQQNKTIERLNNTENHINATEYRLGELKTYLEVINKKTASIDEHIESYEKPFRLSRFFHDSAFSSLNTACVGLQSVRNGWAVLRSHWTRRAPSK